MEHIPWVVTVKSMDEAYRFSFSGHPNAADPEVDYSAEPETLVEFTLEPRDGGTLLRIRESGFNGIADKNRREDAFRNNDTGWDFQVQNLARYVQA